MTTPMEKRFFIETLGCAKNQVDSEIMTSVLENRGWVRSEEPGNATVILVNSCSFIAPAKKESIDVSFEFANSYAGVPVVMTGCMS